MDMVRILGSHFIHWFADFGSHFGSHFSSSQVRGSQIINTRGSRVRGESWFQSAMVRGKKEYL